MRRKRNYKIRPIVKGKSIPARSFRQVLEDVENGIDQLDSDVAPTYMFDKGVDSSQIDMRVDTNLFFSKHEYGQFNDGSSKFADRIVDRLGLWGKQIVSDDYVETPPVEAPPVEAPPVENV